MDAFVFCSELISTYVTEFDLRWTVHVAALLTGKGSSGGLCSCPHRTPCELALVLSAKWLQLWFEA